LVIAIALVKLTTILNKKNYQIDAVSSQKERLKSQSFEARHFPERLEGHLETLDMSEGTLRR